MWVSFYKLLYWNGPVDCASELFPQAAGILCWFSCRAIKIPYFLWFRKTGNRYTVRISSANKNYKKYGMKIAHLPIKPGIKIPYFLVFYFFIATLSTLVAKCWWQQRGAGIYNLINPLRTKTRDSDNFVRIPELLFSKSCLHWYSVW